MEYALLGRVVAVSIPFIALIDEFHWYADTLFGPGWRMQPIRHSRDAYRRQYERANAIYNQFSHAWSGTARDACRDVLGMLWQIAEQPYEECALRLLAQEPAAFWLAFWGRLANPECDAAERRFLRTLFNEHIRHSGFIDGAQMRATMRGMLTHVVNAHPYDNNAHAWYTREPVLDAMGWAVQLGPPFQWGLGPQPPPPHYVVQAARPPPYAVAA